MREPGWYLSFCVCVTSLRNVSSSQSTYTSFYLQIVSSLCVNIPCFHYSLISVAFEVYPVVTCLDTVFGGMGTGSWHTVQAGLGLAVFLLQLPSAVDMVYLEVQLCLLVL